MSVPAFKISKNDTGGIFGSKYLDQLTLVVKGIQEGITPYELISPTVHPLFSNLFKATGQIVCDKFNQLSMSAKEGLSSQVVNEDLYKNDDPQCMGLESISIPFESPFPSILDPYSIEVFPESILLNMPHITGSKISEECNHRLEIDLDSKFLNALEKIAGLRYNSSNFTDVRRIIREYIDTPIRSIATLRSVLKTYLESKTNGSTPTITDLVELSDDEIISLYFKLNKDECIFLALHAIYNNVTDPSVHDIVKAGGFEYLLKKIEETGEPLIYRLGTQAKQEWDVASKTINPFRDYMVNLKHSGDETYTNFILRVNENRSEFDITYVSTAYYQKSNIVSTNSSIGGKTVLAFLEEKICPKFGGTFTPDGFLRGIPITSIDELLKSIADALVVIENEEIYGCILPVNLDNCTVNSGYGAAVEKAGIIKPKINMTNKMIQVGNDSFEYYHNFTVGELRSIENLVHGATKKPSLQRHFKKKISTSLNKEDYIEKLSIKLEAIYCALKKLLHLYLDHTMYYPENSRCLLLSSQSIEQPSKFGKLVDHPDRHHENLNPFISTRDGRQNYDRGPGTWNREETILNYGSFLCFLKLLEKYPERESRAKFFKESFPLPLLSLADKISGVSREDKDTRENILFDIPSLLTDIIKIDDNRLSGKNLTQTLFAALFSVLLSESIEKAAFLNITPRYDQIVKPRTVIAKYFNSSKVTSLIGTPSCYSYDSKENSNS